ncbi:site-specific integrase [Paenibacillus terrigena]|uniref:site-specific integrase n=1 Tax=Paenibacillus terrigena TaxID=369333 RepID=UPI0028D3A461|nr:site-specific integrase [Paenibacillus terrigena]
MPVYKNPKAKRNPWYIEAEAGRDPQTGKRIRYKQRGFSTKKEAELALAKWRCEIEEVLRKSEYGASVDVPQRNTAGSVGLNFATYSQRWLAQRRGLSGNTQELYQSILRTHLLPAFGIMQLTSLTPQQIQHFVDTLYSKSLSDTTIKRIFSLLHAILQAAVRAEHIPRNTAAQIEKPTIRRRRFEVWSLDQIRDFLRRLQAEGDRYAIAFSLAVLTGMRQGEILGLRWQDVDYRQGVIRMQQTLTHRGKAFQVGGKTAQSVRVVALSQETLRLLEAHQAFLIAEWEEKHRLRRLHEIESEHGDLAEEALRQPTLVVSTPEGGPLSPRLLHRLWLRLLKDWQLPRITFHDLRHTHASILLQQGVHPKIVSERLGHASVHMTLNTYSHLLPHLQHDMIEPLDQLLFSQPLLPH